MKNNLILIFLFLFYKNLLSQAPLDKLEYGVGCRLTIDFLYSNKTTSKIWINWKLAISQGVAYNINYSSVNYYRPNIHIDYSIMQGGCGTNDLDQQRVGLKDIFKRKFSGFLALTITPIQYANNFCTDITNENYYKKPLYYFDDVTYPVLTNPFNTSFSVGTTFLYNFDAKAWQRIGNIFLSHLNYQVVYSNDGPPFGIIGILADAKDRWFTGQGLINYYNSKLSPSFDNFELTYHKFTGWSKNSYEISRDLGLTEVEYKTEEQNKYNKGKYELRATNSINCYGIGISFYDNYYYDMQHGIHYNKYYAHHISPYPYQYGITTFGQLNYQTILK
jgi:hypothetical protein